MTAFKIEVADAPVLSAFNRLIAANQNPEPALRAAGESLLAIVGDAFAAAASPDGSPWKPNSQATIEAMLARGSGNFGKKSGKLSAKGAARVMAKKPLIGETRALSTGIRYRVEGGVLEFGSIMEYGAMQQFGGTRAEFPNLWGDIPARPFIPVTPSGQLMAPAQRAVIDAFNEALGRALEG